LLLITQLFNFSCGVAAESRFDQLVEHGKQTLAETWDSSDYELYLPVNSWHNRHFYKKEKIDNYNEDPWGLGLGKYRYDAEGNWHAIYGMAFLDSHSKPQLAAGYAYQKMWHTSDNLRFGAGYTLGATVRKDYPFLPIIAPIASIEYKQLALQSTYIFGGNGNGNILFTWIKWQIK
jgi:lipid IVA palmitoyltransferase